MPFSEDQGGLGQGLTETMIIAEAFGRALAVEPYLPSIILSGGVLRQRRQREPRSGRDSRRSSRASRPLQLAFQERQSRYDLADVATTAKSDGKGGYVLEGEKSVVWAGDTA